MKLLAYILCFLTNVGTYAQNLPVDNWTPEDIIHTKYMRGVQISPDNNMVVWTQRKAVKKKDKFVNDIYMTRLNVKKDDKFLTIALTQSDENDYSPIFSRDGETIYFLSTREEGKKLWSMSVYGGEPAEVYEFENGISSIKWLNDTSLAFISTEGKSLYRQQLEEEKDNTVVVEDSIHWANKKVYAFNLKDKSTKRVSSNKYPVSQYEISKDGRWLITGLQMSPHYPSDAQPKSKYYLYDLADSSKVEILNGLQQPGGFQFSPDNKTLYFVAQKSSDPEWNGAGITELYSFNLESKNVEKIPLDWELGLARGYQLVKEGIITQLANGATRKLAYLSKDKGQWLTSTIDLQGKEDYLGAYDISDDGTKLVYNYSKADLLPEYYIADINTKRNLLSLVNQSELLTLNENLKKKHKTRYEVLNWEGYENDKVNGILYYPKNYEPGKKYPLILSIHGGPSGVDLDQWSERWSTYPNLMAQKGAFVLKPNYHGSSNHGLAFVESIKKNYYEPELEDITKAIKLLIDKGMVDEDKLGTMGWSNGAIITTMLTVRYPDMFKAAAPGAGDVNWTSDYGTCRFGVSFDQSYFGGAPWDDTNGQTFNENYIVKSPLFEMEKVKTPTIIFHGSEDRAVPRDQGWEYYRALQQVDQAPVRFLWFPGQPHGLQKITHQLRKMKEEIAWFDKYLFGSDAIDNESLKDDSPLAQLIKKKKLAINDEGLYGKEEAGKLLPEVVKVAEDSIAIGIFEITNAQYSHYNPEHKFLAIQANHPVYKISYQDVTQYIQWLNEQTGQSYRLPNLAEAKKWHLKVKNKAKSENTLNRWAGYDINVEDASKIKDVLNKTGNDMIKPVGSHAPLKIGKATVYDLGGNVKEYHHGGGSYGFSAYDYVDVASDNQIQQVKYTGFRVVLE